jgi:hypothetical protein
LGGELERKEETNGKISACDDVSVPAMATRSGDITDAIAVMPMIRVYTHLRHNSIYASDSIGLLTLRDMHSA